MSIFDKIDEIKKQPEHIRLRWAWSLTAFFALLIIIIWAFSLRFQSKNNSQNKILPEQKMLIENFNTQKKSLENTVEEVKDVYKN